MNQINLKDVTDEIPKRDSSNCTVASVAVQIANQIIAKHPYALTNPSDYSELENDNGTFKTSTTRQLDIHEYLSSTSASERTELASAVKALIEQDEADRLEAWREAFPEDASVIPVSKKYTLRDCISDIWVAIKKLYEQGKSYEK